MWKNAKTSKPKPSNAMEINQVIVWVNDGIRPAFWTIGWWIGGLDQWRIQGSNHSQNECVMYWMDIEEPTRID